LTKRPTTTDLAPFLQHDESVRWTGHPPSGLLLRGYDFFYIPFSIVWAGFVVFWNVALWLALATAFSRAQPQEEALAQPEGAVWGLVVLAVFLIVGLVFLGFGYQILIGRFVSDAEDRARTLYAVTNYRAIIAKGRKLREVRGYELRMGTQISVKEHSKGSGSITFGQPDSWFGAASESLSVPEFKFERIAQVRDVAQLIDEIRSADR
jgi:hypothetical protein